LSDTQQLEVVDAATRQIVATRELLTKPIPRRREFVELPELGDNVGVWIREWTPRERSEFEDQFTDRTGKPLPRMQKQYRERLVVEVVRDADDNRLLTAADVEALGNQAGGVIERIVNAAMTVCRIRSSDLESLAGN